MDKGSIQMDGGQRLKIVVQTGNLQSLIEATNSLCDKVRFGSEFCAWKIESPKMLEKAYNLCNNAEKELTYITPRIPESSLDKIKSRLSTLNDKGSIDVVVNDWGVLNIVRRLPNLQPYLGRQLVYMPARCPWSQEERKVAFSDVNQGQQIFSQTNLNYLPTIRMLKDYGIQGADVDGVSESFSNFDFIVKNGLNLSVHLHSIPVAIARSCHTARLLGVKNLARCPQPCNTKAFLLKQKTLEIDLFLHGNVVYRLTQPTTKEIQRLNKIGVVELIITMSPLIMMRSKEIDALIHGLEHPEAFKKVKNVLNISS